MEEYFCFESGKFTIGTSSQRFMTLLVKQPNYLERRQNLIHDIEKWFLDYQVAQKPQSQTIRDGSR